MPFFSHWNPEDDRDDHPSQPPPLAPIVSDPSTVDPSTFDPPGPFISPSFTYLFLPDMFSDPSFVPMPNSAVDTFTRVVAPGGWGVADIGGTWAVQVGTASQFSTNGTVGQISALNGAAAATLGGLSVWTGEATFDFNYSALPTTGNLEYAFAWMRVVDVNNFFRVGAYVDPSGALWVRGEAVTAGVTTTVFNDVTVPGVMWSSSQWFSVRAQLVSSSPTVARVKLWPQGGVEPGWVAVGSTTAGPTGGAAIGLRAVLSGGATGPTVSFDNFGVPVALSALRVPSAPVTPLAAAAGATSASVTFAPAADDGGAIPDSFRVTQYISGVPGSTTVGASSPITVAGLTSGTTYTFTVAAHNSVGFSPESVQSNAVTPTAGSVPAAPSGASAVAGNGQVTVSWTPGSNGGSPITGYTVTSVTVNGVANTSISAPAGSAATSVVVGSLTNGTSYTFNVTAQNAIGSSPPSNTTNSVTPASGGVVDGTNIVMPFPVAVGNVVQTAGMNTGYVGHGVFTAATLTLNTSQTITLGAGATLTGVHHQQPIPSSNSAGNGAGGGGVIINGPNVTITDCWLENGVDNSGDWPGLRILWTELGGPNSTVTYGLFSTGSTGNLTNLIRYGDYYCYRCFIHGGTDNLWVNGSVSNNHIVNSSLSNPIPGEPDKSTVLEECAIGFATCSATANSQGQTFSADHTDLAQGTGGDGLYYLRSRISRFDQIISGEGDANLIWKNDQGPCSNFTSELSLWEIGAPQEGSYPWGIISFYNAAPGGVTYTRIRNSFFSDNWPNDFGATNGVAPAKGLIQADTLAAGQAGWFNNVAYPSLRALIRPTVNGPGNQAAQVDPPYPVPAPTAAAISGGATVTFGTQASGGNPFNVGNGTISQYTVTPYLGATAQTPVTGTTSPVTVSGLSTSSYTFTVKATNSAGTGIESAHSNAVTPTGGGSTVPGIPTGVTAAANGQSGQIVVSWTAPSNGGSVITSYVVTTYLAGVAQGGTTTVSGSPPVTQATVSGLTNGTTYTFSVHAVNGVGAGGESAQSAGAAPSNTASSVPFNVTATNFDAGGALIAGWTAPTTGTVPDHFLIQLDPPVAEAALDGTANVGDTNGPNFQWCTAACTFAKFSGACESSSGASGGATSSFANGTAHRVRVQGWSGGAAIATGGPNNDGWSAFSAFVTPTYRHNAQGTNLPIQMYLPDGTPVGVPAATVTAGFTGGTVNGLTVGTANASFSNMHIKGGVTINAGATNVSFTNCYFEWIGFAAQTGEGAAVIALPQNNTGNGLTLTNCTIDLGGAGAAQYGVQGYSSYTLQGCDVHGGIHLAQEGYQTSYVIKDSYLWDVAGCTNATIYPPDGSHNECTQIGNSGPTPPTTYQITHTRLECYVAEVSPIHCQGTNSGGTMTVNGCWFAGGEFTVYNSPPMVFNLTNSFFELFAVSNSINGDLHGTGVYRLCGGKNISSQNGITQSGNTWWGPKGGAASV